MSAMEMEMKRPNVRTKKSVASAVFGALRSLFLLLFSVFWLCFWFARRFGYLDPIGSGLPADNGASGRRSVDPERSAVAGFVCSRAEAGGE